MVRLSLIPWNGVWRVEEEEEEEGGIPTVKWHPLVDRSCTSGASLRTSNELVLSKFVRLIVLLRQNGVRGHVTPPRG